jgi:hypothetical protein
MSERDERLERLVGSLLRELPPRQAPATLEARVLQEIGRRVALPWWRKSFLHWPQVARIALVLALLGVVKLAVDSVVWLTGSVRSSQVATAIEQPVDWMQTFASIFHSLVVACNAVIAAIPPQWLYLGLLAGGTMYFVLFGAGAVLYRALNKS